MRRIASCIQQREDRTERFGWDPEGFNGQASQETKAPERGGS